MNKNTHFSRIRTRNLPKKRPGFQGWSATFSNKFIFFFLFITSGLPRDDVTLDLHADSTTVLTSALPSSSRALYGALAARAIRRPSASAVSVRTGVNMLRVAGVLMACCILAPSSCLETGGAEIGIVDEANSYGKAYCDGCGYACDKNCDCGRCNTKPGCMTSGQCLGSWYCGVAFLCALVLLGSAFHTPACQLHLICPCTRGRGLATLTRLCLSAPVYAWS